MDKPFIRMICHSSAAYMKMGDIFSEVHNLAGLGIFFFFHMSSERHIFDIRVTTLPVFVALLQTT